MNFPSRSTASPPSRATAHDLRSQLPDALRAQIRCAVDLQRERASARADAPLPTSIEALDRLLGGGLGRGTMVELVGRSSCGRLATVLSVLATATATGEPAALVDRGGHLDPQAAARAGIDLDRLLWIRPRRLPEALTAAEMLVTTGFPVVVLEAGLPPVRGRAPLASWLRLARASAERGAVVLVGSPYPLSGCASEAVLRAGRNRARWWGQGSAGPCLLDGLAARWYSARRRGHRTDEWADILMTLPDAAMVTAPRSLDTTQQEAPHVQAL